jgi:hypothetical protein
MLEHAERSCFFRPLRPPSLFLSAPIRPLKTAAAFQTVVNPITTRDSPIHDAVYASISQLGASYQRYVPWLPYPKLGIAAMEPPSGSNLCTFVNFAGTWDGSLDCGNYGTISNITFASYGTPNGQCGSLTTTPSCDAPSSLSVVQGLCVGNPSCVIPTDAATFGGYSCGSTGLRLAVQATCSGGAPGGAGFTSWDFTYTDPGMLDWFEAAGNGSRTAIPNFSTPPQWLYSTTRALYPDDPLGETWDYEQGNIALDPTYSQFADYYGRLYAHYLEGGFFDEAGVWVPGMRLNISHIEILNEIEGEHSDSPETYTLIYDQTVAAIRKFSPTGSTNLKFVGLALEGEEDDYVSYFLNHSNHAPGTPLDVISMHHYASCGDRSGGDHGESYEDFFPSADSFVSAMSTIIGIRDTLSPETMLDADEIGVILPDDNDGKWTSEVPGFTLRYWNAAAAYYAYLFGTTSVIGLDILGESQLVGYPSINFTRRNGQAYTAPPQFPSVAMLNWTDGTGTARYWTLKLLIDEMVPGAPAGLASAGAADWIIPTSIVPPPQNPSNPFCGSILNLDTLTLTCADAGSTINSILFASYGTPTGTCPSWTRGACDEANTTAIVKAACLGQSSCNVVAGPPQFSDPCYNVVKYLDVVATCTGSSGGFQPTASAPVYAQAYRETAGSGAKKVLVVNKSSLPQSVTIAGATGGTWKYVDESTGFGPAGVTTLKSDTIALAPFALGIVRW